MTKKVLVKVFTGIMAVCVVLSQMGTYAMAYDGSMPKQPVVGQPDKDVNRGYTVSDENGNNDSPSEPEDDSKHPEDSTPPESGQPSDEGSGGGQAQDPNDDEQASPDEGEETQPDDDAEALPDGDEEAPPDDDQEILPSDGKKIKPNGDAAYSGIPMHIDAGMQYSLVLNEDGSVWAWGCGESGQLGNGGATDSPVPVRVAGLDDVYAVSSGYAGSLVVANNSAVFGWGNAEPQTGDEASDYGLLPAQIPDLPDISGIFAGKEDNLAICRDGKVMFWEKDMGEDSLPKDVPGLSDIRYAVTLNGLVIAVDHQNDAWVCADPDDPENRIPLKLTGNVKTVSAAGDTIYILKNDGTVWSRGMAGILSGAGNQESQQMEGVDQIVSIAAREDYGLLLKNDGTVWMWGGNGQVRSAVMEPDDESSTQQVMKLDGISEIAAGPTHCLALGEDGSVWGWGDNSHGAVGDFPDQLITEPVLIIPGRGGLLTGDITLSVSQNNTYYLPVEGRGIASFEGKSFKISYDSTVLKLIDFAAQLPERYTNTGSAGNELFIESTENGEIIFKYDKIIPPDREWSGLITLLLFEGIEECETAYVSIAEEKPDDNTEQEPEEDESEDETEEESEGETEPEPEDGTEQEPDDNTEQEPEDSTEQDPEDNTEPEPEEDTEQEPNNNADSPYLSKEPYDLFIDKRVNSKLPKYSVMV